MTPVTDCCSQSRRFLEVRGRRRWFPSPSRISPKTGTMEKFSTGHTSMIWTSQIPTGPTSRGLTSTTSNLRATTMTVTSNHHQHLDNGDRHSHRLVDNDALDGESISLATAALTCGIAQESVMANVASDTLQQSAHFENNGHHCVCLTVPDRFLIRCCYPMASKIAGQKPKRKKY